MSIFSKPKYWVTPGGEKQPFYEFLQQQTHIMVAGRTGSGKSVLERGFINNLVRHNSPSQAAIVLIDPKRVELKPYANLPHCIGYARTVSESVTMLNRCAAEVDKRFSAMDKQGLTEYPGAHLWVIVDEFADLMFYAKKETEAALSHIATIGRTARVHLLILTQRPTRDVITGKISVNITCPIALNVFSPQDSRNILHVSGAECLPQYGECLSFSVTERQPTRHKVPMTQATETEWLVNYWRSNLCKR